MDGSGWVWMTCAINSTHHQSWRLGFMLAVGPIFCSRKVVYCYLKYIHGAFIFRYVSWRTYFIENFDFPKERGISLVVSTYKLNKILKKSPMTLLESPHPSPLFLTSLAIVELLSPLPNPHSHHCKPPEPLLIPIEPLSLSPNPSHLSSNPFGPLSKSSGCCQSPLAVVDPVYPLVNPFRHLRTRLAVFEPIWLFSITFLCLQTHLTVVSLPLLWNPSGSRKQQPPPPLLLLLLLLLQLLSSSLSSLLLLLLLPRSSSLSCYIGMG